MRCLVTDILPETPDTQTLRLGCDDLVFKPGQAISLTIPGDPKPRFYSLSSSPSEKGYLAITIKAERGKTLYDSLFGLQKGSSVEVAGPYGSMVLPDHLEGPFYFLAAGSGVTPFRSMIKYLMDVKPTTEMWLFHSAKTPDDLLFKEEFLEWGKNSLFHFTPTFTRWNDADYKGDTGRIGEEILKRVALDKGIFFLCGPKEFVKDMEHVLTMTLQIPAERIRREQWST